MPCSPERKQYLIRLYKKTIQFFAAAIILYSAFLGVTEKAVKIDEINKQTDHLCSVSQLNSVNDHIAWQLHEIMGSDKTLSVHQYLAEKCNLTPESPTCSKHKCDVCYCDQNQQVIEMPFEKVSKVQQQQPAEKEIQIRREANDEWNIDLYNANSPLICNMHSLHGGYQYTTDKKLVHFLKDEYKHSVDPDLLPLFSEQSEFKHLLDATYTTLESHFYAKHLEDRYAESRQKTKQNFVQYFDEIGYNYRALSQMYKLYEFYIQALNQVRSSKLSEVAQRIQKLAMNLSSTYCGKYTDSLGRYIFSKQTYDIIQSKKTIIAVLSEHSSIFNCFVCERCQLLGKILLNGLVSGLKVLLQAQDQMTETDLNYLVLSFYEVSESIKIIQSMHERKYQWDKEFGMVIFFVGLTLILFLGICLQIYINMDQKIKRMFRNVFPSSIKSLKIE